MHEASVQIAGEAQIMMLRSSATNPISVLWLFAIGASVGSLAVSLFGIYSWSAALPFLVPLVLLVLTRYPIALAASIPFVGMMKPNAASEFSFTDPTFLSVATCGAAVGLEALLSLSGIRRPLLTERFREQSPVVISYFLFVTVAVCSMSYAAAPTSAVAKILRLLLISTLLFMAPSILARSERQLWQFVSVFVLLSTFIAGRTLLRLIFPDPNVTDITAIDEGQAIGAALLVVTFSQRARELIGRLRYLVIPLLAAGLFAGAARGPILSVMIAGIVGWFATTQKADRFSKMALSIPLAIMIITASVLWLQWLSTKNQRFEQKQFEMREMLSGNWHTGASGGKRIDLYDEGVDAFRQRPLLGWGIGGWTVARYGYEHRNDKSEFQTEYPHNIFVETAVEEGAVGLVALMLLLTAIARTLRRIVHSARNEYGFLLPVCLYCLLVCMFSNDINNRLFWAWIGATVAAARILGSTSIRPRFERTGGTSVVMTENSFPIQYVRR